MITPEPLTDSAVLVAAGALCILSGYTLVMQAIDKTQRVFGRKPPLSEVLQTKADGTRVDHLEVDIRGFTTVRDFDAYKEEARIRLVGLEKQISEARHEFKEEMQGYLTRAEERDAEHHDDVKRIIDTQHKNGERMSAVEKSAELILQSLHNLSQRLDRNIERGLSRPS